MFRFPQTEDDCAIIELREEEKAIILLSFFHVFDEDYYRKSSRENYLKKKCVVIHSPKNKGNTNTEEDRERFENNEKLKNHLKVGLCIILQRKLMT